MILSDRTPDLHVSNHNEIQKNHTLLLDLPSIEIHGNHMLLRIVDGRGRNIGTDTINQT